MHILVVDDDQAVRDSLARSLQYSGYEVTTANDGVDALARLSSLRPDAVIMDVMMPRLDGLETTRSLRASGNDVPILVLTARDAVGDAGVRVRSSETTRPSFMRTSRRACLATSRSWVTRTMVCPSA